MVTLDEEVLKVESLLGREYTVNIWSQSFGDEKISFLARNHSLLEAMLSLGFTGYHLAQIVLGAGWSEKLDRISGDYERVWRPLGFTPSHIAKIVSGKGWERKLLWVETMYEKSSYTPAEVTRIMSKKDWQNRLVGYERN